MRAEVRALLSIIARDNLRHPIYRNHVEWIHPLIEKFVVPTMVTVAKKVWSQEGRAVLHGGMEEGA